MLRLRARLGEDRQARKVAPGEPPLRSELFSAQELEQHGKALAGSHRVSPARAQDRLLKRLAENKGILLEVRTQLTDAATTGRRITPAEEWLLDNFYLIEGQISTARRHLPKGYSQGLPRLSNGPSAGLPRVYDIALEQVSHGDGRVDPEGLNRFVAAYQSISALQLGELWAIPIMLRLALIENLRRIGARIAADSMGRDLAHYWADQMTAVAEKDPKSLILVIADMARSDPPMVSGFVAELAHRLQRQNRAMALPLTWIEQRLSESGQTINQLAQSENQQQAADQVSMSNSIGSLRFLEGMDWRAFVEGMSAVERVLRRDPGCVYAKMDFVTRDRYRHVVERIAKSSLLSESEVARIAIQLAEAGAARKEGDERAAHVGFYLIDKGLPQLERAAGVRVSPSAALRKWCGRRPLLLYGSTIVLLTVTFAGLLLTNAHAGGLHGWALGLMGMLSLLGTSHLAVALTNRLVVSLATPHPLPRMDFSQGIPPELLTLVVVPTMLTGVQNIEDLIKGLEIRFVANRDRNLLFGLLTDFRDALDETLPEDKPLLQLAQQRIEELNRKYEGSEGRVFFLFHRPRRWNPYERIWMGYERKRGKLADLNSLLRAGTDSIAGERFSLVVGDTKVLSQVKYVISLDTDTQLARDTAFQFVAAMAHPLNRARYDEDRQRVTEGYGILQPRVAVSLPAANRSRYARLLGSEAGIDPYTRLVSDVYQDLFGEGSFIGKGIYEVDAFERATGGRFPDNRILSHDLLEGCYARAGLLSDVELYEEYPACYGADVSRRHRWIRGDWQIAQWLMPFVPGPDGRLQRNPLSMLSRLKIIDNLRRSLTPSALTLLLLLGWTVLPSAWVWTWSVSGIILIPSLIASVTYLFPKPAEVAMGRHLATALYSAGTHLAQAAFWLVCLPYEAFFSLDAMARATWRMLITQKRLLEWNPSGDSDRVNRTDLPGSVLTMWIAPVLAAAAAIALVLWRPAELAVAGPILSLWFVSPLMAWWISRPLARRDARLTADQTHFLRKLSRKTWVFFETFVGPEDHWLPLDNYQEHPVAVGARRTSPTNMGLALLANLCAYDFGYLSAGQFLRRTKQTLHTMEALERYRGHFFNWYDTQSLKPLPPRFISSVDSGNLAGHLLTLRQGLLALPDDKILGARWIDGLSDTLRVLMEVAGDTAPTQLVMLQKNLASAAHSQPTTLVAARQCLEQLAKSAAEVIATVDARDVDPKSQSKNDASFDSEIRNPKSEIKKWWARALAEQCRATLEELAVLAPWTVLFLSPKDLGGFSGLNAIPTLRQVANLEVKLLPIIEQRLNSGADSEDRAWLGDLRPLLTEASRRARARIAEIERLARQCGELAQMEYDFLFDEARKLLAIGYNLSERRRDAGYYDLLASEARFCSFVAIACGQLPQEHWFALGRPLTTAAGKPTLLSWNGSMFEYLMPLLVMPTCDNTLLDGTCKAVVAKQIEYGKKRGVPWGISESGYHEVDLHRHYQYRALGVPGLGLKRGLGEDLVVAPYATALALMVAPEEACLNLEQLAAAGLEGNYGFYEAIDYTSSRLPQGQTSALVRCYMANHQGMSFLALACHLLDRPMQKRFESDPRFQATMLLLQERIPKAAEFYVHTTELP